MHVALVCPYSFADPGGVQSYTRGLARALRGLGHDVTVFAPDALPFDGIHPVSLGRAVRFRANGSVAPVGLDPRMLVRFELALDAADVVHVQEPFQPASIAAAMRTPRGVPVVGTFHAAGDRVALYGVLRRWLPLVSRRLSATTASSDASRDLVRRYVDVDPLVVPNGVDVERLSAAQPDPWAARLGRVVLFVGRPEPRKGLHVLLAAFAGACAFRPDVHLVCAGPVPNDARLFVEGFPGRIHCLGRVADERRDSLFRAADVFCAPNLGGESFGIVLAEAMAAGCPVLASDIAGFRAAASDAAVYVPPGDIAAWREALAGALDDTPLRARLAGASRKRAERFDWSVVVREMLDVYDAAAA